MEERVPTKKNPNGITGGMISVTALAMSMILILGLFKVYLSNRIYLESRKVNKTRQEVEALKAERKMLKQRIEALLFKQQIADTIFSISDKEAEKQP